MRRKSLACLLAITATWGSLANMFAADSVTRKDGSRVSGEITGATKSGLTIKPTVGDAVTISSNEIGAVDWDGATADLRLGVSDENGGRFDSALARVTKSKAESTDANELLKHEFDFVLARIAGRMAMADATKLDGAISQLEGFRKSGSDHFRFYEAVALLGQLQLVKGDYAAATATFEQLGHAESSDYKLAARIAQGRIQMAEGKNAEAEQSFDAAIASAGNSPAEQARKFEAMLGKARALATQSKQTEALAVLEEVISKAPATATALQAEAYVLQGNALQALNRNKEAVLAYLHVDILFPRESGYHAEALYHMARLWKTVQAPERGLDAEAKLTAAYPNSEWAKKLSGSAQ